MTGIGRRRLLGSAAATASLGLLGAGAAAQPGQRAGAQGGLRFGPAEPFSFERLVEMARERAARDYMPPSRPSPAIVQQIDYDAYGRIRFKADHALYADGSGVYPITFKMVGQFFTKTVRMYAVAAGQAREILYSPDYFDMPADHVARQLGQEPSAFAGFWVEESRLQGDWTRQEPWVTFLGAAYWRAKGELGQVGMSSRAVAIGTGEPEPEEFPDFVAHWFEPALAEDQPVTVYSLMDGPNIAGAFHFRLFRTKGVVIEVANHLFMRGSLKRLGIAPLTSMFWFGENNKRWQEDWRPEVHDSDGLALWTGPGERIWRPLANNSRIVTSVFIDRDPKGFGLMQRDRDFEHYLDGVRYESRPSTWIEPLGPWGDGAVHLVEIPTDDEIYDNINTFWVPSASTERGSELQFAYRQHWLASNPYPPENLALAVSTRIGRGGEPGKKRPVGFKKVVVEFEGGPLADLPADVEVEPVVWASHGEVGRTFAEPVPRTKRWRAVFDIQETNQKAVDLRLYLKAGEQTLSETWLFQLQPDPGV